MKDDLSKILETMDVPEMRLVLTPANIRWLLRNLRISNADHPDLAEVTLMLKDQIRREDVLHFNIFDHRS
jgi:hypothetical protein